MKRLVVAPSRTTCSAITLAGGRWVMADATAIVPPRRLCRPHSHKEEIYVERICTRLGTALARPTTAVSRPVPSSSRLVGV